MSFKLLKEKQINETEEFKFFAKEIDYLIDFFNSFFRFINF